MTDQILIKGKRPVREVLDRQAKYPHNMMYMPIVDIWASLCGGYDDDAAYDSPDPDAIYGPILDLGTSIIQTDRPEFLISYLKKQNRH